MNTTTYISGLYGMLTVEKQNNQTRYYVEGGQSDQTEDGEVVFNLGFDNFECVDDDAPVYASVYEFDNNGNCTDYATKADLIAAATERLQSENLPVSKHNIDFVIMNALSVCDYQTIEAFIENEIELDYDNLEA